MRQVTLKVACFSYADGPRRFLLIANQLVTGAASVSPASLTRPLRNRLNPFTFDEVAFNETGETPAVPVIKRRVLRMVECYDPLAVVLSDMKNNALWLTMHVCD